MTTRVRYLEGLRGIAALQVVLLHFVTAFAPNAAEHAPAPLPVLFDGHTAVYVFFLISGAVLTPSFARGGHWPNQAAKRLLRPGIPVAAAIFALIVLGPPDQ
jgi:peptidoglycan/LPS O-acetylase OafA/YrhL